jgi:hypothetical protein
VHRTELSDHRAPFHLAKLPYLRVNRLWGIRPSTDTLRSHESEPNFVSCESQDIVHDHVSVPGDLKNGQAVLDLTP